MSKIRVVSDTHCENWRDAGRGLIHPAEDWSSLDDVLVFAGDIANSVREWDTILPIASDNYRAVLYVLGNHEYYELGIDAVNVLQNRALRYPNVHILNRDVVDIDGVRFAGCTLWYEIAPFMYGEVWSDFAKLTRPFVAQQAAMDRAFIAANAGADVIVTHMLPHVASVHPKYRTERTNAYFLSEVPEVYSPGLWLHGHTHMARRYRAVGYQGSGRVVVCNPMGHPSETVINQYDDSWVGISMDDVRMCRTSLDEAALGRYSQF